VWFPAGSAPSNNRAVRLVAPAGKAKDMGDGVLPGIASWPPKPITEHGQPKPEDDPANFEGTNIVDLCAVLLLFLSSDPLAGPSTAKRLMQVPVGNLEV